MAMHLCPLFSQIINQHKFRKLLDANQKLVGTLFFVHPINYLNQCFFSFRLHSTTQTHTIYAPSFLWTHAHKFYSYEYFRRLNINSQILEIDVLTAGASLQISVFVPDNLVVEDVLRQRQHTVEGERGSWLFYYVQILNSTYRIYTLVHNRRYAIRHKSK